MLPNIGLKTYKSQALKSTILPHAADCSIILLQLIIRPHLSPFSFAVLFNNTPSFSIFILQSSSSFPSSIFTSPPPLCPACVHASTSLLVTADLEVSFSLSAEINVPEKVLITCLGWEAGLGKGKDKSVVGRERNGGGKDLCMLDF